MPFQGFSSVGKYFKSSKKDDSSSGTLPKIPAAGSSKPGTASGSRPAVAAPSTSLVNSEFLVASNKIRKTLQGSEMSAYDSMKTLGTGSFGRVRLAKHRGSGKVFAIKMLSKSLVIKSKQVDHIMNEKAILSHLLHPFIINLYHTFQDTLYLYFVLEYSAGGELFSVIRKAHRLPNDTAQFFAACVVSVMEYLHSQDIVYRDLKPENLLLDKLGYIKVCDFGFAKVVEPCSKTWTLCGTPEYLAPEIILNKGHGRAVDWWATGILIFEMLVGYPPFEADDRLNLYQMILRCEINFPRHVKKEARELISGLVTNDLSRRLGNLKNGPKDITNHAWFRGLSWEALHARQIKAPVPVTVKSDEDASNFDDYDDADGPDAGAA
mmetsp:Transcript_42201/g.112865  ORF Transcript_42201/g.112865 Transcript_42201/m.112865 type:complete len:379 (+) Transcript_42201:319-1455(+)